VAAFAPPLARAGPTAGDGPTPVAARGTPPAWLAGAPADPATAQAVAAAMREALACVNGGNYLAVAALVTDDYLRFWLREAAQRRIAASAFDPRSLGPIGRRASWVGSPADFLSEPAVATAGDRVALVAVRDVRLLADGRVGALVETADPTHAPRGATDIVVFVEAGGRYLIDEEYATPGVREAGAAADPAGDGGAGGGYGEDGGRGNDAEGDTPTPSP
jgi:hypothetical protein